MRLQEIEEASENLEWNHAAILFQRLNDDLESKSHADLDTLSDNE